MIRMVRFIPKDTFVEKVLPFSKYYFNEKYYNEHNNNINNLNTKIDVSDSFKYNQNIFNVDYELYKTGTKQTFKNKYIINTNLIIDQKYKVDEQIIISILNHETTMHSYAISTISYDYLLNINNIYRLDFNKIFTPDNINNINMYKLYDNNTKQVYNEYLKQIDSILYNSRIITG